MKAKTRRKLEMGGRAFIFGWIHADRSPNYAATLARLENRLARANQLAVQQRDGLTEVGAAAARKRELRGTIRRLHLAHLRHAAWAARFELPELWRKFRLNRGTIPYQTFRTTANFMAAEAEAHKEILTKHGLADEVLENLAQALQDFDRAVEQGMQGHQAHVGASAALDMVADEVVRIVKVMTGINRFRFAHDAGVLAQWATASNVIATPRSPAAEPPAPITGDVRPAA